jgi:hypothetical protein
MECLPSNFKLQTNKNAAAVAVNHWTAAAFLLKQCKRISSNEFHPRFRQKIYRRSTAFLGQN